MRLDRNDSAEEPILPKGFAFSFFMPFDELHWGRIETSVLEFPSENDAIHLFKKSFLPHTDELQKRCLFVLNPDGVPIATANAWFVDSKLGHQASLHWVAVCPDYQGQGIGKAIVQKALQVYAALEPNQPIWLHTQTWSHIAIRLYHSLGFNLVRNERLAKFKPGIAKPKIYPNDFNKSIQVLKAVMDEEYIDELLITSM
jgi:GNAT superfamily N-acetyltransferase